MTNDNKRYKTIKLRLEGSRFYDNRQQLFATPAEVEVIMQSEVREEMIRYLQVTPLSEMRWTFYEGLVTPEYQAYKKDNMTKQELKELYEATPEYKTYAIADRAADNLFDEYNEAERIAVNARTLAFDTPEHKAWMEAQHD